MAGGTLLTLEASVRVSVSLPASGALLLVALAAALVVVRVSARAGRHRPARDARATRTPSDLPPFRA